MLNEANQAVADVKAEIEALRGDIESAELSLAQQLSYISTGDAVHANWTTELTASQSQWGSTVPVYPGGPVLQYTFLEFWAHQLSVQTVERINWLADASESDVAEWLAAHPDFAAVVGFVEPAAAVALWTTLAAASTRDANGDWSTGPLAQLFALAPFASTNWE